MKLIQEADPQSRPIGITIFAHGSERPHFSRSRKTKQLSSENSDRYWRYCGSGRVDHWWLNGIVFVSPVSLDHFPSFVWLIRLPPLFIATSDVCVCMFVRTYVRPFNTVQQSTWDNASSLKEKLIHSADPYSRLVVIIVFAHVRTSPIFKI